MILKAGMNHSAKSGLKVRNHIVYQPMLEVDPNNPDPNQK